jgi:phthiocerol/phenolphthiocerol synthesis type-I polyketide synthase C
MKKGRSMKVAIVGAACRLPGGVHSLETLWDVLASGCDAVGEIPPERFDVAAFRHPRRLAPGRSCTFAAGLIGDIESFDYAFFGISRKEAEYMDPQQRLLLELAWEALEDAQIRPSSLAGSATGVYIGSSSLDGSMARADDPCVIGPYSMIGNTLSLLANRISYLLDIRGPSMTIDTACSSSLVALHQACQALATGETRMAIAGGVHLLCSPLPFVGFSKAHMLAADGRCKVFAADAKGYARAEGGVALLLKPLDAALADGDRVLAVIDKTGINTDGRTIGIAFPNQDAQMDLLRALYDAPDIDIRNLCYMEAHGTGTTAGDPVEARSIGQVFSGLRPAGAPLLVGSIKSNLGHLEPVSGLAGLLKTVLVLQKGLVPPNLHLDTLSPDIDFERLRLAPVTRTTPVPDTPGPRLAGVSSFGFGGANAHIVLEQAPATVTAGKPVPTAAKAPLPPLLLSAKSSPSLRRLAGAVAQILGRKSTDPEAGRALARRLAGRLALRRDHLSHRLAVSGPDPAALAARLTAFAAGTERRADKFLAQGEALGGRPKVAFAFSGNGGPWPGMGRDLLTADPDAAAMLDRLDGLLAVLLGWSVRKVLLGPPEAQELDRIEVVQPLLFALQVCLFTALAQKGLVPDMVCGHSIGEVAAGYASGALTLEAAGRIIVARSELQREAYGLGGMAVVQLSAEEAAALPELAAGDIEIAAVNSPRYLTLTGPDAPLDDLLARLKARRLVCRRLSLRYPFHSRAMEPVRERLLERLAGLAPGEAAIPFYSAVTGGACPGTALGADYWWRNIRQPVLFASATTAALADGARILVEIGPDAQLAPFLKACREEIPDPSVSLSTLRKDDQDPDLARHIWQQVHVHGGQVDLARFFPVTPPYEPLPAYPWDREHCLAAPTPESLGLFSPKVPAHPLLGRRVRGRLDVWENTLDLELTPFLADHRLDSEAVLPGAAYLEMALAAARETLATDSVELENVEYRQPLTLAPAHARKVRLTLAEGGDFRIESRELMQDVAFVLHVLGRIVPRRDPLPEPVSERLDPTAWGEALDVDALYLDGREAGLAFGPCFRPLAQVWRDGDTAHARLSLRPEAAYDGALLHPVLLDGAFQELLALASWHAKGQSPAAYLPMRTGRLRMLRPGLATFAQARLTGRGQRTLTADFRLFDADGALLARAEDCRFARFQTRDNLARQQQIHALTPLAARHPLDDAPAALPDPDTLARLAAPVLAALAQTPEATARRREALPFVTAMLVSRLHQAVTALAPAGARAGTGLTVTQYLAGGIAPEQETYLRHALGLLADMDLARRDGECFRLLPCDLPPEPELWREAFRDFGALAGELVLAADWAEQLEAVLGGQAPAVDVPERLWRACPARRDGQDGLAALLDAVRRALPPGAPLCLLELTAGQGDRAGALLARLVPGAFAYLATDPDPDRVERLRARFADRPGFTAAVLDPDDPAAAAPDALPPGGAELVVAGHELAGLADPVRALSRARALLRPGGLLLMLALAPHPARHLLCGLDPDWWRDDDPRGATQLPTAAEWTGLCAQAGFAQAVRLDGGDDSAEYFLLAARKAAERPGPAVPARPASAARRHLLLADAAPAPLAAALADALTQALTRVRQTPILVTAGTDFAATAGGFSLDPERPEHWDALFSALADPEAGPVEILHLMGLDDRQDLPAAALDALVSRRLVTAGLCVRAWQTAKLPAGLCLVTGGGVPLAGRPDRVVPSQGPLVGFGRVCVNEAPSLTPRLVDVQAGPDGVWPLAAAVREILSPLRDFVPAGATYDREVVLSGDSRHVLRLAPLEMLDRTDPIRDPDGPMGLEVQGQGRLDGAVWRRVAGRHPGPGEVLIANRAAGANYRDVMFTLGRIPEEALEAGASGPSLGLECAGEILAVGPGVTGLAPGQAVCCLSGGCYDAEVVARAETVFPLPEGLGFAEAATIPVAHFTAYYALVHLARLAPGERVLIHGAAGGVGQAAIQLARMLGTEVLATAGSPAKRLLLARLGVAHVFDSRSLDFADQVLAATGGMGVDVVLNSIAGEALQKSLAVLAPLGRFLELGKVDFYANSPLRMRLLRHNITFHAIDVDEVVKYKPALCRRLFEDMLGHFERRELTPLPHAVHSRSDLVETLRLMQHSGHVGKLVVVPDARPASVAAAPTPQLGPLSPEAGYLVTGGLGGLGRVVARRLVALGARHLVLVGRSGAATEAARAAVADLIARGAAVTVVAADLSDETAVTTVLGPALAALPPLAGVVHCAGILRDATIANLDPDDYQAVVRAKFLTAWNLHHLTAGTDLDFFVLFSSATTVLGNPGQANYVAANTGLEALAAYRRSLGLAATSFGWGPVTDTGMLAERPEVLDSLRRLTGAVGLTADDAMDFVELFTRSRLANLHVFRMRLRQLARLPYVASPVYDYLAAETGTEAGAAVSDDIREVLRDMTAKEAVTHLAGILSQHFARILRLPASRIRHDKPLGELGMDSLMYVELGLATEEAFGVDISSLTLDKTSTILSLAAMVHAQLGAEAAPRDNEAQAMAETIRRQHGLHLSEDATRRLLGENAIRSPNV